MTDLIIKYFGDYITVSGHPHNLTLEIFVVSDSIHDAEPVVFSGADDVEAFRAKLDDDLARAVAFMRKE